MRLLYLDTFISEVLTAVSAFRLMNVNNDPDQTSKRVNHFVDRLFSHDVFGFKPFLYLAVLRIELQGTGSLSSDTHF